MVEEDAAGVAQAWEDRMGASDWTGEAAGVARVLEAAISRGHGFGRWTVDWGLSTCRRVARGNPMARVSAQGWLVWRCGDVAGAGVASS